MALRLETEIQFLKGVGPKLGALFWRNSIKTVLDLLQNYPRAYEDRRAARNIVSLKEGDVVSLKASVVSISSCNMGRSSRKIYDILVRDQSGQIRCKFFRTPYKGYFERFQYGKEVRVVGKVTNYRGRLEFHHPDLKDVEPEEDLKDALIPIYVEIEGLSSAKIEKLVAASFDQIKEWPSEKLPLELVRQHKLISLVEALYRIHQPEVDSVQRPEVDSVQRPEVDSIQRPEVDSGALYNEFKSVAHRRIIFDEFFWLELYLASKKTGLKNQKGLFFHDPKKA